jgi:asparagine synthase (glutamine-hydrolysing)
MSAIAGILGQVPGEQKLDVSNTMALIRHRGTTADRIWSNMNASLSASALAGIDPDPGPAIDAGGKRGAVFDGYLTNEDELRGRIQSPQRSGAPLVLDLFDQFGAKALEMLDGHYAVVVLDKGTFYLARDRLGVRPLYYGFSNHTLRFSSEIKGLVDSCQAVRSVPPGALLTSDQGVASIQPIEPASLTLDTPQAYASMLADLLMEAVVQCIPMNAEVGCWLSGGVDSSVVAALAQQSHGGLLTFSAGLEGAPDLESAKLVSRHLGTRHEARIYNLDDALRVLEEVIFHLESFDAPLVRSAIGNYLVAQLAAEHVPFVLSGEGGDELFAGYAHQKEFASDVELTLSVQEAIAALHNTALQRVDRSASAHHTRAGLPFLDPRVVSFALAVPSSLKIRGPDQMEKWLLREALAEKLPAEVIWRRKAKFWEGAGAANLLAQYAEEQISDSEYQREMRLGLGGNLRSKEELLYFRIYQSFFGERVPIEEIGRTKHV